MVDHLQVMLSAIGNTPLVRLKRLVCQDDAELWVKIEGQNPTGSYKDRMALAMVEAALADASLKPGMTVLECTGGSTGSSVAFVCAVMGIPFTVISSDAYAQEKLDSMRALGAELMIEPSIDGAITPDLWLRMRARASAMVATGKYLWLDQFKNPNAAIGYRQMGEEIVSTLNKNIDAFCGAVGTAGMIMGVGGVIRESNPDARIIALEPASSAVLSGGQAGSHNIDGTAAGFVPDLFSKSVVTEVSALPEQEARKMAKRLAKEEGIFAGTSTGLNVLAAIDLAQNIGKGGCVVTVACDTGFKYLNGPLFRSN